MNDLLGAGYWGDHNGRTESSEVTKLLQVSSASGLIVCSIFINHNSTSIKEVLMKFKDNNRAPSIEGKIETSGSKNNG